MKLLPCSIPGMFIIENKTFKDARGSLTEVYQDTLVYDALNFKNVLELEVQSSKGVLRGLHYQLGSSSQAKIIRVVRGSILDVAVDIRRSSNTFGEYCSTTLDSERKNQLYIPRGFAHGYYTLENNTKLIYKLDNLYNPAASYGIVYDDQSIGIDWRLGRKPILSSQDASLPKLLEAELFE